MSEINVTPLVDVMLVLLIIFMVTAPMMKEGLEVTILPCSAEGFLDIQGVRKSVQDQMKANSVTVASAGSASGRMIRQ